jgi:hypothetical protein
MHCCSWAWTDKWTVDKSSSFGAHDADGWYYGPSFERLNEAIQKRTGADVAGKTSVVRKRRWLRTMKCNSPEILEQVQRRIEKLTLNRKNLEITIHEKEEALRSIQFYEENRAFVFDQSLMLVRLENIRKNEEFLKSLGLVKDPLSAPKQDSLPKSNKGKAKRKTVFADKDDPDYIDDANEVLPVRRSSRKSGLDVKHVELSSPSVTGEPKQKRRYNPAEDAKVFFENMADDEQEGLEEDSEGQRVVLKPAEIRDYIESANPEHSAMISNAVSADITM